MKNFSTISVLAFACSAVITGCGKSNDTAQVKFNGAPEKFISNKEVRRLVVKNFPGFSQDQVDKMYCIAYAESTFDIWRESYVGARGLFQVMPVHFQAGEACAGFSFDDMYNPQLNAACAYRIYLRQGFDAWDPYYFAQRDPASHHAVNYLDCRQGKIGWGE